MTDLTGMTDDELQALLAQLHSEQLARADRARDRASTVHAGIEAVEKAMRTLIGPDGLTTPNQTSIRGMRLYTDAQLQQYAGLALRLVLTGLEQIADAVADLAVIEQARGM